MTVAEKLREVDWCAVCQYYIKRCPGEVPQPLPGRGAFCGLWKCRDGLPEREAPPSR